MPCSATTPCSIITTISRKFVSYGLANVLLTNEKKDLPTSAVFSVDNLDRPRVSFREHGKSREFNVPMGN